MATVPTMAASTNNGRQYQQWPPVPTMAASTNNTSVATYQQYHDQLELQDKHPLHVHTLTYSREDIATERNTVVRIGRLWARPQQMSLLRLLGCILCLFLLI